MASAASHTTRQPRAGQRCGHPRVWVVLTCAWACQAGACGQSTAGSAKQRPPSVGRCEFVVERAGVSRAEPVNESSGIAAASTLPDAFWVHNDSGDGPRLYAMSREGALLGTVQIEGAQAEDWEDMAAVGVPGGGRELIIGDVGDNFGRRATVQLYRLPEPRKDQLEGSVRATRHDVTWPDGPRDVEAIFVDPRDRSVYLIEKNAFGAAQVYRVVLSGPRAQPERVASISMQMVTAADMSPDGSRIVVRNYRRAAFYERAAGQSVGDALAGQPCELTLPEEPQGEAIAFATAHSLLSLSEQSGQPVYVLHEVLSTQQPAAAGEVP